MIPLAYIILSTAFVLSVLALALGWRWSRLVASAPLPLTPPQLEDNYFALNGQSSETEPAIPGSDSTPFLSVVVWADRDDTIDRAITDLTSQRTLFPYEVIMVCNASARETASYAERYARIPGLRFTFVPPEAEKLSRRKLAFTVGIKSAQGKCVLLTASSFESPGPGWLQLMGNPMFENPQIKVVAGTTRFRFGNCNKLIRLYRSFIWVMAKCRDFGSILAGRPFRADWANLAMTRDFFFQNKGYASTIHIETGDDDVFLYKACHDHLLDASEVDVALAPAAMPVADWGEWSSRIWKQQRLAYDFTRKFLPRTPFLISGFLATANWAVLALCLSTLFFNWMPMMIAAFMWLCFQGVQIVYFRNASRRLLTRCTPLLLPFFLLWHPVGNFIFRFRNRETASSNYTWQH